MGKWAAFDCLSQENRLLSRSTRVILYKYLSPERIDVLTRLKIRFTQVAALNDPFESLPGALIKGREYYLQRFKECMNAEAIRQGIQDRPARRRYLKEQMRNFDPWVEELMDLGYLEDLSLRVQCMASRVQAILSLSGTARNILMWSHYARDHTGYIIGFDGDHEYFGQRVTKVEYSELRPSIDPTQSEHPPDVFHTKSVDWSYEEEYRLSQPLVSPEKLDDGGSFLPDPGRSLGFDQKKVHLFDFPKDSVREIIFGWKTERDIFRQIVASLEHHGMTEIRFFWARPHESRYEMRLLPCDDLVES